MAWTHGLVQYLFGSGPADDGPHRLPNSVRPLVRLALLAALVWGIELATASLRAQTPSLSFSATTAIRVASGLAVLRYPLAGFLLVLEVDKWDWYWLGMPRRDDPADHLLYQQWDKTLDLTGFAFAASVARRWPDRGTRMLTIGAFVLRLFGVSGFLVTDQRWLLIVFPNAFENFYLLYVLFHALSGRDQMLRSARDSVLAVFAIVPPKLAQEYFLHEVGRRPWDLVHLTAWPLVDVWMWAVALYALPAIALLALVARPVRAQEQDPAALPS